MYSNDMLERGYFSDQHIEERKKQLLREAKKHRLAQQALKGHPSWWQWLTARLGRRLPDTEMPVIPHMRDTAANS